MKTKPGNSTVFNLEQLLLEFNLARREQIAKTTYQDYPGELDAERYFIYKDPECFRTTTTVDSGFQLKTIIIADPTLSTLNANSSLRHVHYLLNILREHVKIFVWTGDLFQHIQNMDQFFQCYTKSLPLLDSELEQFKKTQNLNQDNVVVLDHTCLQSTAHYIYNTLKYERKKREHDQAPVSDDSAVVLDTTEFPPLTLGPQVFSSDLLMSLDQESHEKIVTWHCENNYPLHLRLNGYAKNKIMDFIKQLKEYPQIVLYFDDLLLTDLITWLSYLKGIPVEQITGLKRTWHKDPEHFEKDANLLVDYIHTLTHLRYLHYTFETNVSPEILDLTHHTKLSYLSIYTRTTYAYLDTTKIPSQEEADRFLAKLPPNLRYLHLPAWSYSFSVLKHVLNERLAQLVELGVEPQCRFTNKFNTDNAMMLYRDSAIQFLPKEPSIEKPSLKLFSNELLGYINGRLYHEKNAFNPFAYTELGSGKQLKDINRITTTNLNNFHYELADYVQSNKKLSLAQLNEQIDNMLKEKGLLEIRNWSFYIFYCSPITLPLLLAILARIEHIHVFKMELFSLTEFENFQVTLDCLPEIQSSSPAQTEYFDAPLDCLPEIQISSPPKIEYFTFQTYGCDSVPLEDFVNHFMSQIELTHYASLPGTLLSSNNAALAHIQALNILEIDDQSTNELINAFPNTIISTNLEQYTSQPKSRPREHPISMDLNNDVDTIENPEQTFSVLKIFDDKFGYEIPVNYHRMQVITEFKLDDAFENQPVPGLQINIGINELTAHYYEHYANEPGYYLGRQEFIEQTEWNVIPTLGNNDDLYFVEANAPVEIRYQWQKRIYEIRPLHAMNTPLIIRYMIGSTVLFPLDTGLTFDASKIVDAQTWFYQYEEYFNAFKFIQFTENGIVGIERFNSALPQTLSSEDKTKLICAYFATFTSGELQQTGSLPHQIDQAIFSQKLGSCRHRAKLAHKLLNAMGIVNNLVWSKVHLFLDIILNDELTSICLGGFRAITETLEQESNEEINLGIDAPSANKQVPLDITQLNEIDQLQQSIRPTAEPVADNPLLITYPELDLPTPEIYQQWLNDELNKKGARRQMLLLVDSLSEIDSLEQETFKYIHNQKNLFATIDNFQKVKFFELHISNNGQHQQDTELGTMVKYGGWGDLLWIPIRRYQAATINPLFDHRRQLKNKTVPQNVFMIAIMERRQFTEMGDDFISRFPAIYSVQRIPCFGSNPGKQEGATPFEKADDAMASDEAKFIFGASYLSYTQFAGGYELKGKTLQWSDGWLANQINNQTILLSLINAPIYLPEFDALMKSLKKGFFYNNGYPVAVPANLTFRFEQMNYVYPDCFSRLPYSESTTIHFVLNKLNYINFFKGNYHAADGQLHQNLFFDPNETPLKDINILVTDQFDDREWYSLFIHANRLGLKLHLIAAPYIVLPEPTGEKDNKRDAWPIAYYQPREQLSASVQWIECIDPHERISMYPRQEKISFYLSRQTTVSDLLGSIVLNDSNSDEVTYKETEFTHSLRNGTAIILYGDPSLELRNTFESLLCTPPYLIINGQKEWVKGSLQLCFTVHNNKSIAAIDLSLNIAPKEDRTAGFLYKQLDTSGNQDPKTLINNLFNTINAQRITLLTGLTSSLKPLWLHQLNNHYSICRGINQLTLWLNEGGLLILDHYNNASLNELALVEQIHQGKDQVYWQDKIHHLSESHKLLLLSSAKIETNHPAVLTFKIRPIIALDYLPLSQAASMEQIIWPAWQTLCPQCTTPSDQQAIKAMLIEYSGLKQLEALPGSALGVLYYLRQSKDKMRGIEPDTALLCELTLQILCPKRSINDKYMRNKVQDLAMHLLQNELPATLLHGLTPMQLLMTLNLLIQLRLLDEGKENTKLKQLMVKGLLFEGAPGIGKTYLSLEILKALGYKEVSLADVGQHSERGFIQAPTDDLLRCKKVLRFAQEQGYIVLLDELNTISQEASSRNERSLLAELIEALEPGQITAQSHEHFFVIANQNTAVKYSNRLTLPSELQSLFLVIDPGHFRKRDYRFFATIHKAENPKDCASFMKKAIQAYEKKPGAYRPPTIRTLLDYIMETKKQSEQINLKRPVDKNYEMSSAKRRKLN